MKISFTRDLPPAGLTSQGPRSGTGPGFRLSPWGRGRGGTAWGGRRACGVTILEIMISVVILGVLAGATVPLVKRTVQRQKEMELRRALRTIREAIDEYKTLADEKKITDEDVSALGYPPDLETLVEGVQLADGTLTKKKFRRRSPKDPMTNSTDWGLRSYQDDPESKSWGRENVFDIYTRSAGVGLDETPYADW
ncbi:MAG: type II secretion system protein [Acidobacteriota bacterium]